MKNEIRYRKGHFIGLGIAFGLPSGIPLGLMLGNIAFGPLIGLVIGIVIGLVMEKAWNKSPIMPSKEELRRMKRWSIFLFVIGSLILVMLISLYFLNR